MAKNNEELYRSAPISKAVVCLSVPTVISQIITVIYNMADTFFIGKMNDPAQVAAATISIAPFVLQISIANLLGIGGASLISRCLGRGDREKAKRCSAFCIYTSAFVALLYGLAMITFRPVILPIIGAKADTYDYCFQYLFWTVTVGAVPTVMSVCLAHLIRAEGFAKEASYGVAGGGILNMILDPLFIFVLDMGITGAAVATMLSNCASAIFFITIIYRRRNDIVITLNPKYYTIKEHIPAEVCMVGLPSCIMNLMAIVSNTMLNRLAVSYSTETMAGMGIAKKLDMVAFAIGTGMTQGVLSLIAYNYAAKNYKRMIDSIKITLVYALSMSVLSAIVQYVFAEPLSIMFIKDALTVDFSQQFLKVICLTCPTASITMIIVTVFQAMGKKVQPLILSILRKGAVDIPFMFILSAKMGAIGIAWATPITDIISLISAILLFIPSLKKLVGLQKAETT